MAASPLCWFAALLVIWSCFAANIYSDSLEMSALPCLTSESVWSQPRSIGKSFPDSLAHNMETGNPQAPDSLTHKHLAQSPTVSLPPPIRYLWVTGFSDGSKGHQDLELGYSADQYMFSRQSRLALPFSRMKVLLLCFGPMKLAANVATTLVIHPDSCGFQVESHTSTIDSAISDHPEGGSCVLTLSVEWPSSVRVHKLSIFNGDNR